MSNEPSAPNFRIDVFYKTQHRRLRNRFRMSAIDRHEARIMRALDARRESLRASR